MNCSIIQAAPASINIVEAANGNVVIAEAQPCSITIDEADQPLITLQQPAAALVTITAPAAASLTVTQPSVVPTIVVNETGVAVTAFAQRDYLGAVPTYSGGTLVQVAYSDGTQRLFTYYSSGLIKWIDYLAPNQTTLRKTITWDGNGAWTGTTAPAEVI